MTANSMNGIPQAIAALTPNMAPDVRARWIGAITSAVAGTPIAANAKRLAMFFGQCAEESGGLTVTVENLSYASAERLRMIYGRHFPTAEAAAPYLRNPQALGNFVYANRLGNGPVSSGDGYRYRGHGLIQITGRGPIEACHGALAPQMEVDGFLAWMQTPEGAARSAVWWWDWRAHHDLYEHSDRWSVPDVTMIVNGTHGNLSERMRACNVALAALSAAPAPAPTFVARPVQQPASEADALNARVLAGLPLAGLTPADVPGAAAEFGA